MERASLTYPLVFLRGILRLQLGVDPPPPPRKSCRNVRTVQSQQHELTDRSNSHWIIIESKLYVTVIQWRIRDLSEERRQLQKLERRANHRDELHENEINRTVRARP